jgi:predicted neuraminidase
MASHRFPGATEPGHPVALVRLPSGRLLLAGNTAAGQGSLALWIGDATAKEWHLARTVESAADGAADFSEPSLLSAPDGWIHLAYSWRRQGIRYMSFSEAWLDGGNQ